jgi:phospholipase/carboxylesterase
LIAREVERGIPSERIVLAGFSQGCAMVLHTGLRHPSRLAGIMALSGYLPLTDTLAEEASAANRGLPIYMAHGTADPMVPIGRAEAARDSLLALKYPVEWHSYPMQHSVHPREVQDMAKFLQWVLAPKDH